MKKLKLAVDIGDLNLNEEEKKVVPNKITYNIIEQGFLLHQREKGLNVSELVKIVNVLNLIENKDEVEIEDADYEFLKKTFEEIKWPSAPRAVVKVYNLINSAEKLEKK